MFSAAVNHYQRQQRKTRVSAATEHTSMFANDRSPDYETAAMQQQQQQSRKRSASNDLVPSPDCKKSRDEHFDEQKQCVFHSTDMKGERLPAYESWIEREKRKFEQCTDLKQLDFCFNSYRSWKTGKSAGQIIGANFSTPTGKVLLQVNGYEMVGRLEPGLQLSLSLQRPDVHKHFVVFEYWEPPKIEIRCEQPEVLLGDRIKENSSEQERSLVYNLSVLHILKLVYAAALRHVIHHPKMEKLHRDALLEIGAKIMGSK